MRWRWYIVDDNDNVTGTNNEALANYLTVTHVVINASLGIRHTRARDSDTPQQIPEEDPSKHIDPETRRFYE